MVPDMGTLTFNVLQLLYIILRINLKEMSDFLKVKKKSLTPIEVEEYEQCSRPLSIQAPKP